MPASLLPLWISSILVGVWNPAFGSQAFWIKDTITDFYVNPELQWDKLNRHTESWYVCSGTYKLGIESAENRHILGNNRIILESSVCHNIVVSFLSLVETRLL